jgi:hypothetical protein
MREGLLDKFTKLIRSRLRGLSFVMMHQAAIHRVTEGNQYFVSLHAHGIVRGPKKRLDAIKKSKRQSVFGTKEIVLAPITNLAGCLNYMSRDQRIQYAWAVLRGAYRSKPAPMYSPQLARIIDLYGDLAKPELCLGSGIGPNILRRALKLAIARGYRPYDDDA